MRVKLIPAEPVRSGQLAGESDTSLHVVVGVDVSVLLLADVSLPANTAQHRMSRDTA